MTIAPSNITESECESRKFPLKELGLAHRPPGFQVVVPRSVLNEIKKFGRASMRTEIGGMLAGVLCWDREPFVVIEVAIEGKYTDNRSSSVTFTSQTWDYVHGQIEQHYPTKKIVGWYHTHPSFGVFLSKYDLFICRETFNAPFHVAYVFDPHIENRPESEGFFVWRNSQIGTLMPCVTEDAPSMIPKSARTVWKVGWVSAVLKTETGISETQQQKTEDKIRIVIPPEPTTPVPVSHKQILLEPMQALPTSQKTLVAALKQALPTLGRPPLTQKQLLAALNQVKQMLSTQEQTDEPVPLKEEQPARVPPLKRLDVTG